MYSTITSMNIDSGLVAIGRAAKILGVSIDTLRRWDKSGKFSSVRIGPGGNRYYRKSDLDLFVNDWFAVAKKWATSTHAYEPEPQYYCRTRDVFQARLENFQSNLVKKLESDSASLISAVTGEVGNNSFDHNLGNWPDVLGVYFAYSLSEKKIVLADRGLGILATLKRIKTGLASHEEALRVAFTETISGRFPESRGNGLKFVRKIVTQKPFSLFFQTGDAFLNLDASNIHVKIEKTDEFIRGCLAVVKY
ncbi:MAG: hypothetical protein UV59_C0051G0010 [Candidatus Gottesmanbacteria bacterium GW2011_GWA1_43_11]|uniref:HTH merR-type domain-containing protein n=1 Tax=Candidatus Gottesmanbacteria bacterium GW2011_GWA1_43_11 TaxID=1618436 RepID=A0A0G1F819_9BACT|nr:MAG: hypothetical protein UV59_C0051G0010 [Candidatus Gottesmanbacteria bacterium GW2011_GWA1_43_11]